jgi:hypothetical protein
MITVKSIQLTIIVFVVTVTFSANRPAGAAPEMNSREIPEAAGYRTGDPDPATVAKAAPKNRATPVPPAGRKAGSPATPKAASPVQGDVPTGTERSRLDLTPTQEEKLLTLLNRGTNQDLAAISGVAAVRADAIVEARPFRKVHDVILVPGVGEVTFERILNHGKTLTRPAAKSPKS